MLGALMHASVPPSRVLLYCPIVPLVPQTYTYVIKPLRDGLGVEGVDPATVIMWVVGGWQLVVCSW